MADIILSQNNMLEERPDLVAIERNFTTIFRQQTLPDFEYTNDAQSTTNAFHIIDELFTAISKAGHGGTSADRTIGIAKHILPFKNDPATTYQSNGKLHENKRSGSKS